MIDLLNFSWYYWMILTPLPESGNMKLEWTWRTWPMAARQLFWLNDLCIAASLVVYLGPLWWCCDDTVVILWWYFIELDDGKKLWFPVSMFPSTNPLRYCDLWKSKRFLFPTITDLVNSHITMENHHAINGKIHYFNGSFSIANCWHNQRVQIWWTLCQIHRRWNQLSL